MPKFKNITPIDFKLLKEKYDEKELQDIIDKIETEDYPVQYAIGNVEFLNTIIDVDERVLIPRFATELLVDKTKKYIDEYKLSDGMFVDICTGSGCIAIALKKAYPNATIEALDISNEALALAKSNSKKNNVNIEFHQSDILNEKLAHKYSLIISNPPYVSINEEVSPNTKYEPQVALYPGNDDIIFYKRIINLSKTALRENGMIAFEVGNKQARQIINYAKVIFPRALIRVEKDYEGYERFVFIKIDHI